jgi:hypothetical protein
MEVKKESTYVPVPKNDVKTIKLYWDDNFFELPWKGRSTYFWNDLREHVDSSCLRLRGMKRWIDPQNANFRDTYIVHSQGFLGARTTFLNKKHISVPEAETADQEWRAKSWEDWESGVKEKHPTRAETRRIAEEGSFKRFISEDLNPYCGMFQNCSFDAQEGLIEMGWQLQRAKLRAVRNSQGTLFGPKNVADAKEMERRRVVAEHIKTQYELLKSTQLVLDAINWRVTDERLAAT